MSFILPCWNTRDSFYQDRAAEIVDVAPHAPFATWGVCRELGWQNRWCVVNIETGTAILTAANKRRNQCIEDTREFLLTKTVDEIKRAMTKAAREIRKEGGKP